jgi:peptidoglycan-associated lipoprotein
MQKKLLSLLIITAITYSCSKGLSPKDDISKSTNQIQTESNGKNQNNEIARKIIYFDTNNFVLNEEKNDLLKKEILPLINSNSKITIIVEGHCDERGSNLYNKKLGKKRAQAIKKFLVKSGFKSGFKSSKISVVSYGENKPLDLGHDENAWSKNRRAEIVLFN